METTLYHLTPLLQCTESPSDSANYPFDGCEPVQPSLSFLAEAQPRLENRRGQRALFGRGAH
jgi:hypothetical protein